MANDDKIGTIVNDPDFQSLGLADQQQFLSKVDPDFSKLKTGEFSTFLARYKGAQQQPKQVQIPDAIAQARQAVAKPVLDEAKWQDYILHGPTPGVSEGSGLREGLGEYVGSVGSKVSGGVKDISQGKYSRGISNLIRGTGEAIAAPTLPFAVGAPLATGAGLVAGTAGSQVTRKAAQMAGATPDQQQLAGDIGGFVFGGLGAKGAGMLPNASRAGATMNQIVGANKDVPVPSFEATSAAVRAKEIFQAGAPSFPAPMRKFLVRVMDPDKPPLTVGEARDFYTASSKQTAKEWSEMSAPMKRQMAQFTSALGDNIEQALNAKTPGAGTNLRQAMDEYHGAMQVKTNAQKLLKWGGGAIGGDLLVRSILKRYGGK